MASLNWNKANRQRLEAQRRRDEYENPNANDGYQRSYSRRSNSSEGGPLTITAAWKRQYRGDIGGPKGASRSRGPYCWPEQRSTRIFWRQRRKPARDRFD